MTTTYFPRWRATIDGTETTLNRVNGSFIGIRVPPGHHVVRLRYQPTDHLAMVAVSAAALVLTMLTMLACGVATTRTGRK